MEVLSVYQRLIVILTMIIIIGISNLKRSEIWILSLFTTFLLFCKVFPQI